MSHASKPDPAAKRQKLIAGMRNATFKAMPATSSRFSHMAKNKSELDLFAEAYVDTLPDSNAIVDFSDEQITEALEKYDASFGETYGNGGDVPGGLEQGRRETL